MERLKADADGDIERLIDKIDIACCDWRDVLSPAEYPAYGKCKSDVEKEAAIASDWNQYNEWLNR